MTKTFAPPLGADPEFDAHVDKAWEAVKASGNVGGVTHDNVRETLARRFEEYGLPCPLCASRIAVHVCRAIGHDQ